MNIRQIYQTIDGHMRAEYAGYLSPTRRVALNEKLDELYYSYPAIYKAVLRNRRSKGVTAQSKAFKSAKNAH